MSTATPVTAPKTVPKTVPNNASVSDFIATVTDENRRADCLALIKLMEAATAEKACLWGSAIVGFGSYEYPFANGGTGQSPVVAFSPRKNDLTVYITPGFDNHQPLLARLGKHKTGKVCLYIKRLADVDSAVLKELVHASVADMAPKRLFKHKDKLP